MTRILVVDDDRQLLRALRINLTARGYEPVLAPDGATALALASRLPPDLMIVDLGLPDIDGVQVVEGIRGWSERPIIRQLLQEVWGSKYETETNYLRVYLAQLRAKLEPDPARPRYLITEPGMGYRFRPTWLDR